MRLAWFTPLPPERSGISAYSAELLPELARQYSFDIFTESSTAPAPAGTELFDAHDFIWKHQRRPYDLSVYQLGNATCHDYMWPYLFRFPGLVVLHDGQLHLARARLLLQQERHSDYRAELRFNHPDVTAEVADLGITGLLGSLHYFWPMLRTVVDASRCVAVHSPGLATDLHAEFPEATIADLAMGVPAGTPGASPGTLRPRHAIPENAVVFAAFGRITPEKRISQIIQALAAIGEGETPLHLLLVGESAPYYDPVAEAQSLGISDRVTLTGFVDESDLADYLECADICLCLRWPSARETSASWLRCLAAGKATIVTDLAHTVQVPSLDPRSWMPQHAPEIGEGAPDGRPVEPICVSLDILDEDHSLRLAMRRLAQDDALRSQLGRQAHAYWQRHHTLDRMVSDYQALLSLALDTQPPARHLPGHLRPDGLEHALTLAAEGGYPENPFDRSTR
ncbi:MAG: glycosyltransferase family 4 protein [Vicinamibacterales bacterium]|jgi:glycosyltransferase involved in cell wall biosynthesis|nr:glycosyltransferase family 4 protein [Vicinamibacterales bacterium]